MWMPTAVRRAIFRSLFENGILVVSSNDSAIHEELGCLNIYANQVGRSFVSRGFAKKQYAWSHAYYTLTDKGIEFLRDFFGAPANVQPATLQPRDNTALLQKARDSRSFNRGGHGGFRRDGDSPRRNFRGHKNETDEAAPTNE